MLEIISCTFGEHAARWLYQVAVDAGKVDENMMTIAWNQAKLGDVLEIETRNYGKIRGIVDDVSEPGFPKPIGLSTNYGGFVLYRDTSPQLTVVARGATYPTLGDFSIFG